MRIRAMFMNMLQAVSKGDIEVIDNLLKNGEDINAWSCNNATPLSYAICCAQGSPNISVIKFLLEKGADINAKDKYSSTPLGCACSRGFLSIVKYLVQEGAIIDNYAFHCAVENMHIEVVQFLVGQGADVNGQYINYTPLTSVIIKNPTLANYLLEKGADINAPNAVGSTPLHFAVSNGTLERVEFLLKKGAKLPKDILYLAITTQFQQKTSVAQLLINSGANVNCIVNNYGWTPLHQATYQQSLAFVKLLVENGADINAVNDCGQKPISLARDSLIHEYLSNAAKKAASKEIEPKELAKETKEVMKSIPRVELKPQPQVAVKAAPIVELAKPVVDISLNLESEEVEDNIKSPAVRKEELAEENQKLKRQIEDNNRTLAQLNQQLESASKTSSASKESVVAIQKQLNELREQQAQLFMRQQIKIAKQNAIEAFKLVPNAWQFYHTFYNRLEAVFVGVKAGASGFMAMKNTHNDLNVPAKGLTVAGKLVGLIPVIGNTLDTIVSGAGSGVELLGQERLSNQLQFIAGLASNKEIEKSIEACAMELTTRYMEQLTSLQTREEAEAQTERKSSSLWEGIKVSVVDAAKRAKNSALKTHIMSDAEQLALYAVMQIVGALLDDDIKANGSLSGQFIQAITKTPGTAQKIRTAIITKLGVDKVVTRDKKPWLLHDIFRKPGIKTQDGACYAGNDTDPDTYKYRVGTVQEAEERSLRLQKKQPEKKSPAEKPVAPQQQTQAESKNTVIVQSGTSTTMVAISTSIVPSQTDRTQALEKQVQELSQDVTTLKKAQSSIFKDTEHAIDVNNGTQVVLTKSTQITTSASVNAANHPQAIRRDLNVQDVRTTNLEHHVASLTDEVVKLRDEIEPKTIQTKVRSNTTSTSQPALYQPPQETMTQRKKSTQARFNTKLEDAKTFDEVFALYQVLQRQEYLFLREETGSIFRAIQLHGPGFLKETTDFTNTWCNIVLAFKAKCIDLLKSQERITYSDYLRYQEIFNAKTKRVGGSDIYRETFDKMLPTLKIIDNPGLSGSIL